MTRPRLTTPLPHRLTDRQAEILAFLRSYIAARKYPPTVREIGARFGIRSTNAVADVLRFLERKGFARRDYMRSRSIVLLDGPGEAAPTPPETSAGKGPEPRIPVFADLDQPEIASIRRPSGMPTAILALVIRGESLSGSGIRAGDWLFCAWPPGNGVVPAGKLVVVRLFEALVPRYAFPFHEGDLVRLTASDGRTPDAFLRAEDFTKGIRGVACGLWRGAEIRASAERAA